MAKSIFVIFLGLVLVSCKNGDKEHQSLPKGDSQTTAELNKLKGEWELFKVSDTVFSIEKVYAADYGGQPVLTIDTNANKIGGFTGCNSWGTSLKIQNNSFVLNHPIEMHQQGCGGTWEEEFLNFLKNNKSFHLQEENLKLTSGDGRTMTFKKADSKKEAAGV